MQKVLLIAIALVAVVLVALIAMLVTWPASGPAAAPVAELGPLEPEVPGYVVPEFAMVDQDGQPTDQSVLEGEVTVLAFIFTNCPFACPGMTGQMIGLQQRLDGTGVRLLSISVDPANDTPEVLRAYADRVGADRANWRFLTGDFEVVQGVVRDGLDFEIGLDETRMISLPSGGQIANVRHPEHLILVGPDREVLGIYHYTDAERMRVLASRARRAADEVY
ncbi:MAG: SCO family protein [Planctomycetota bacterium]